MNKVEEYLIKNPNLKLSVKSIAKRTSMKTKQVTYLCHHSKLLRQVNPSELGCGKHKFNTFCAL